MSAGAAADGGGNSPASMETSSTGESGRKAKRKTYTAREKELVVMADQEGGRKARMEVAHMLGMPARTADKVVAMFKEHGKEALHDHRRDRNTHLGQNAKYTVELLRFVMEWLHLDAKLSYAQLRDLVNLEIFRGICHDFGLQFPGDEGKVNRPIAPATIERFFALPQVREAYAERHVEAEETIGRWMDGLVLSRKHLLDDAAAVNGEADCANRLTFAQDLLRALEDPHAVLVFVDEVPFHLKMRHPPGGGSGRLAQDAQVAMAFNAHMGLLASEVHAPRHAASAAAASSASASAVGSAAAACAADSIAAAGSAAAELKLGVVHDEGAFKRFLNQVLLALEARKEELRGKNVYVISDCPAEFLRHVQEHQALDSVPAFEQLNAALQAMAVDSSVRLIKMAPNSPPLNLGEFFNRRLREAANALLHEWVMHPDAHAADLRDHRRPLLHRVLERALQRVGEAAHEVAPDLVRMVDLCKDVIADGGRLDMAKTYDLLVE